MDEILVQVTGQKVQDRKMTGREKKGTFLFSFFLEKEEEKNIHQDPHNFSSLWWSFILQWIP